MPNGKGRKPNRVRIPDIASFWLDMGEVTVGSEVYFSDKE